MPVYQYHCEECGQSFEREEHVSEHEKAEPQCPECGSEEVQQVVSPFFAKTAKKS